MPAKKHEIDLEKCQGNVDLVPVCAWCGKVRDNDGVWREKDRSSNRRSGVYKTHGACTECAEKFTDEVPPPEG